ncbi:similar to Saccharomyces cerevisiae YKL155C RSM22 Mitochondrial ribosomal protein of the small subunit [Maudiozyma saulgeensis]|uniref:Similar to Saccharomyces cerevisiae YKL155C RSM22 Mitochondrial ribosomal protein of the small subunit n=1 Tax=Maudiozyma saulgeensis TaxID=1789683 RepID=A0A1X7R579_9SACH|nr:similar to Saccharomyces cerevisiae YKL155C RSM22 Mitochondrial ribosomal protein of the small subunit [Kazachstania saulgeensis]
MLSSRMMLIFRTRSVINVQRKYSLRASSRVFEQNDNSTSKGLSAREARLQPETLRGRTYRPMLTLNSEVAKAINNNITALHLPNNLRRVAKNQYLSLQEKKLHQVPKTELEIDSHIASFFLHDYGSIYQVLMDLKNIHKENFKPKNVLDVSMGPATGIVAFNDVMGPDYRCNKDSVIEAGPEMQKRAKIILSRQYNEIPDDVLEEQLKQTSNTETKIESDESADNITEGEDLVGEVMTKKIKIQTKLKNFIPMGKQYDLIIISHQLLQHEGKFPIEVDHNIEKYLKLLAPGGHIVVIERGTPLGFETVARARQIMIRPERYPDEYGKIPRPWIAGNSIKEPTPIEEQSDEMHSNQKKQDDCDYHLTILAPCPHHRVCPLQTNNPNFFELKEGKKLKFCSFEKAIKRPKFSLELKKGKLLANKWDEGDPELVNKRQNMKLAGSGRRNGNDYELVHYSYLVAKRSFNDKETICKINEMRNKDRTEENKKYQVGCLGDNTPNTWPRIINHPAKKKGHIILDVCGTSGKIEKWIIPKSFSKEIYHDAKKAYKGDLWGLDAKTKLPSLAKINIDLFKKLEKKRIKKLKQERKEKEREMSEKFNELTDQENMEAMTQEGIKEISEVYAHYYKSKIKIPKDQL